MTLPKRIVIRARHPRRGHGKVTILLDENRKVIQARLHVVEFRGFERFIRGPFWEVRGWCSVCAHLPGQPTTWRAKAMDRMCGRREPDGRPRRKIRRLMHYGQMYQSHACILSTWRRRILLFGSTPPSPSAMSSVWPASSRSGVQSRAHAQVRSGESSRPRQERRSTVQALFPAGVNKNLSIAERRVFSQGRGSASCVGQVRAPKSPRTTPSRISPNWRLSVHLTRTTCHWSVPDGAMESLPRPTCAPSTPRARHLRPGGLSKGTSTSSPRKCATSRT